MAKRGAEALACRAPWESRFSHAPLPKRSRRDSERRGLRCAALWSGGGCKKRKRTEEEDGDTAGRMRPTPSKASGPQKEAGPGTTSLQRSTRPLPNEAASGSNLVGPRDAQTSRRSADGKGDGSEWGPLGSDSQEGSGGGGCGSRRRSRASVAIHMKSFEPISKLLRLVLWENGMQTNKGSRKGQVE